MLIPASTFLKEHRDEFDMDDETFDELVETLYGMYVVGDCDTCKHDGKEWDEDPCADCCGSSGWEMR